MVRYENECCGCATPAYPCRGSACPLRNVPHYYCDNPECRAEGTLYEYEGGQLCSECLLKKLPIVEGSEGYYG